MEKPLLDIVIVNWNAGRYLRKSVESIQHFGGDYVQHVIVVDNASSDDSLQNLPDDFVKLQIIQNKENLGFAKACNQGAALCVSKYILFLNPDAWLDKDTLPAIIAYMESDRASLVGICGVKLLDEDGVVQRHCSRFPSTRHYLYQAMGLNKIAPLRFPGHFMTEFDHLSTREVDQVIGAFFLVRHKLFKQLNGFDEQFFVYFEEVDFSYRANLMGWSSMYFAKSQAFHVGGGISRQVKAQRLFYSLNSRLLYAQKHFTRWGFAVTLFLTLGIEGVTRILHAALRNGWREVYETIQGYQLLFKKLPALFSDKHMKNYG